MACFLFSRRINIRFEPTTSLTLDHRLVSWLAARLARPPAHVPPAPSCPTPPTRPAAWHCLAVYSVATLDGLLSHRERQQLQAQLARGGGSDGSPSCRTPVGLGVGGKPLRRPMHSSASSLPSYGSGFGDSYGYGSKASGGSPAGGSPAGWSPGLLSPPPGCASPFSD